MNVEDFPLPLATVKGEIVFDDKVVTTYALTAGEKIRDPIITKNMIVWSEFMAGQYSPSTFDAVVKKCIDPSYTWHSTDSHEGMRADSDAGYEVGMDMSKAVAKGVTNFHITNRMFDGGGRVVNFWHMTGTHTGEFFGVLASGKEISLRGISISTFKDNKLIEEWEFSDNLVEKVRLLTIDSK